MMTVDPCRSRPAYNITLKVTVEGTHLMQIFNRKLGLSPTSRAWIAHKKDNRGLNTVLTHRVRLQQDTYDNLAQATLHAKSIARTKLTESGYEVLGISARLERISP